MNNTKTDVAPVPACPYCRSSLDPEDIGHGRWLCPCCARTFEPVAIKKP